MYTNTHSSAVTLFGSVAIIGAIRLVVVMMWKLQGEKKKRDVDGFDCIMVFCWVSSPWSPHSVLHEVSLWGKIRLGGFLWLRLCSLSLLPGWVSIGLQVHTLARRPPVAPTNCSIHSSAGDGRRPLIGYQRRLGNFPTASACWQPASHSSSPPGHTRGWREVGWGWGAVTDRKSIGPLSKFPQRSSMCKKSDHSDVYRRVHSSGRLSGIKGWTCK